jgi:hypothetical protein
MREELDKQLCEDYPKIFANRHKSMTETAMCWGFDHGDGWYDILDTACSLIQQHIDWKNRNEEKVSQVVADQVKEKFGTLRFYVSGGDDYTNGIIRMAEAMTAMTCEICGKPGEFRGRSWFYTACDEHTKEIDLKENNG